MIAIRTGSGLAEIPLDGNDSDARVVVGSQQSDGYPHAAAWSPDRRLVAFVRGNDVVVSDVVRNCWRVVASVEPGEYIDGVSWSHDSQRLGFRHAPPGPNFGYPLDVVSADGTGRRTLLTSTGALAWAPDGSGRIAFSDREGLKVLDENTGEIAMLHEAETTEFAEWSPDATQLVFSISVDSGVWVVPATGGGGRRITPSSQVFWSSWSPDGTRLAYAYEGELWIIDTDGTEARALTSGANAQWKPQWSPDGSRIVFQDNDGNPEAGKIMIVNGDGSGLRVHSIRGTLLDVFRRNG